MNERKICLASCLQSHGSCFCYMRLTLLAFISLKSELGFNSWIGLFYEIKRTGGKHCNTKSFILQSKKSICSYIQYHIPPFKYICYVYKRKDSTEIIYRNEMRGDSLNMTHTQCNQELHSDRNELPGESQTKQITGTQVNILNKIKLKKNKRWFMQHNLKKTKLGGRKKGKGEICLA